MGALTFLLIAEAICRLYTVASDAHGTQPAQVPCAVLLIYLDNTAT